MKETFVLHDVNRSENDMSSYSDGYDIAQEAMLFLCQFFATLAISRALGLIQVGT